MTMKTIVALWAMAWAALGCDGYPTDDQPLLDVTTLTSPELIEALNHLSEAPGSASRFIYRVVPDCVLEIATNEPSSGVQQVMLAGMMIDASSSGRMDYKIHVRPMHTEEQHNIGVYRTASWADSVAVHAILKQLRRRCEANTDASVPPP